MNPCAQEGNDTVSFNEPNLLNRCTPQIFRQTPHESSIHARIPYTKLTEALKELERLHSDDITSQ
jgi:hypothetical protein